MFSALAVGDGRVASFWGDEVFLFCWGGGKAGFWNGACKGGELCGISFSCVYGGVVGTGRVVRGRKRVVLCRPSRTMELRMHLRSRAI